MKKLLITAALLAALPAVAMAEDGWSGAGEAGLAASRGNSKSENVNVKLKFAKEDETWKHQVFLTALRSKGQNTVSSAIIGPNGQPIIVSSTQYNTTANRFEVGGSSGYKLDERRYIVGALRYENDDFSSYEYQWTASLGFGYTAIKNERTELSFEIGPGYKRYRYVPSVQTIIDPLPGTGSTVIVGPEQDGEIIGRGLIAFKHQLPTSTAFENTFLVEAGSNNQFIQNDTGLAVSMTDALALKLGYQIRRNSDVTPGSKKTDQLLTTNLVYKF